MRPNLQFLTDFVTFTEELLNGKHFLCSDVFTWNTALYANEMLRSGTQKATKYWWTPPIIIHMFNIGKSLVKIEPTFFRNSVLLKLIIF